MMMMRRLSTDFDRGQHLISISMTLPVAFSGLRKAVHLQQTDISAFSADAAPMILQTDANGAN